MNNQEARFILGAYRPDGSDAADPTFRAALEQAERDPELRAWLEKQQQFDSALARKVQQLAPPPGLREAILAGARVSASQPRRPWWRHPVWLAAAAILVVGLSVNFALRPTRPSTSDLAQHALRDMAEAHDEHNGFPSGLGGVQAQLAGASLPLTKHLTASIDELRQRNCRSVRVGGREVFEICFVRDGTWYHLYVGRRGDFAPKGLDTNATLQVRGEYASATWADANNVYALVAHVGAEALRRVL